jgi:DNA-binding PadR family transcriptional regulator
MRPAIISVSSAESKILEFASRRVEFTAMEAKKFAGSGKVFARLNRLVELRLLDYESKPKPPARKLVRHYQLSDRGSDALQQIRAMAHERGFDIELSTSKLSFPVLLPS